MKKPLKLVLIGIIVIQLGASLFTWALLGLGTAAWILGPLLLIVGLLLAILALMDDTPY